VRAKVALIVAVILGLVAAWGIKSYLSEQQKQVEAKVRPVTILAAEKPIKRGTALSSDLWKPLDWPETALTNDHILWGERLSYIGQVFDRDLETNAAIVKSAFRQVTEGVRATLPLGQQAVTLRVDDISGVAGAIRPNSRVDVLGTLPLPAAKAGSGGDVTTLRLLGNCVVLAVDNRTTENIPVGPYYGKGTMPYSSVTLAVTPQEAVLLTFVQSQGKIMLTLRNPSDPLEGEEPPEVSLQNVRGESQKAETLRKSRESAPAPAAP
jgi:pilus assembly protein CpaB